MNHASVYFEWRPFNDWPSPQGEAPLLRVPAFQDSVHAVKRFGGWKAGPVSSSAGGGEIWFQGGFHGDFIGIAYSITDD